MVTQTFAIDAGTGLIKRALGSAAVTATAYIGTQWDQGAAVVTDAVCRITLEACKVSAGDETYTFRIVGSNVTDRSDGQVLAMAMVGDASTITIETVDSAVGDVIDLYFRTERNNTAFRYIDLHITTVGTSETITFGAYISKVM